MLRIRLLFLAFAAPALAQSSPLPVPPPLTNSTAPAALPDAALVPADALAGFQAWLADYRRAAIARGIRPATVDLALSGLTPNMRVVALDRAQPGDSGGVPARFDAYLARRLDAVRIAGGRDAAARLAGPLAGISASSGVPAEIIVGIWGMETAYGAVTGNFDVTRSLATLAWDGRRRALFTGELDAVLTIVDSGRAPLSALRGSWAGAMGHPQFLPTSYLTYAADGDGDGRADIWNSEVDAAASIANYLKMKGWKAGIPWGMQVTVPDGFNRESVRNPVPPTTCVRPLERHSRWIPAAEWRAMGIVSARPWPADDVPMSLVEPDGAGQGAYLTTGNYRALMDYNCSNFYALSVALLGDEVAASGG